MIICEPKTLLWGHYLVFKEGTVKVHGVSGYGSELYGPVVFIEDGNTLNMRHAQRPFTKQQLLGRK